MTGRTGFWLGFALLAALVGGGAYYAFHHGSLEGGTVASGHATASARAAPGPSQRAVAVEAESVRIDTVIEDLRAVGTLRPNEAVTVVSEIAGRVERIGFEEGKKVNAGAVLIELDASILRAELAKARSDLTLARTNQERALTLARQGMVTERARDEARAALEAAQAGVALAQARLQKTTIKAPLSGVVGLRSVSVGAYVTPGERIVELADVDPIKVDFRVPELSLAELRPGQPIRVTVDALPGKTFEGEIDAIDPIVDVSGRAIRLRARIPNARGELSPGLFARVQIVIERRENAVLVPEAAVFAEGPQRYVYRVVEGRAVLTAVELGQRRPGQVEIRSGLSRDGVVVTAGHQQIRDGARVDVVKPGAGA